MNKYYVFYYSPVTNEGGVVEPTKGGVSHMQAEAIAKEGNEKFKPLVYSVKEMTK